MRTHVALLRGINVGGRNKVVMSELRQVVASLGHTEVTTYIQSGNALFAAADPAADTVGLANALEVAISEQLAVRPAVVVVSRDDLDRVRLDNPFPNEPNPKLVHAVFLRDTPAPDGIDAVAAAVERARGKGSQDEARVVGRTLYLWTPGGLGRSELAVELNPWRTAQHTDGDGDSPQLGHSRGATAAARRQLTRRCAT